MNKVLLRIKTIIKQSPFFYIFKRGQNLFYDFGKKDIIPIIEHLERFPPPKVVVFEPTIKCNLDCEMCYQKFERSSSRKELSLDEIKFILSKLKKSGISRVGIIGGEIFTRPDIFLILDIIAELKNKVYFATNGTLINEKNITELKKRKKYIIGIGYSLDGLKDLHNKIRGRDYAFDSLEKAIFLTKNDFSLTINTVIMDSNIDQIIDIAKLVRSWGVTNFALQFEMFATHNEIIESAQKMQISDKLIGVEERAKGYYNFSLDKIKTVLNELKKIKGLFVFIQPGIFTKEPGNYIDGSLRANTKLICKDILNLRVNAVGDVIFCPFFKKNFGNLLTMNLEEIWNSNDMKKFRQDLIKGNLTPVCKRCCRLGLR